MAEFHDPDRDEKIEAARLDKRAKELQSICLTVTDLEQRTERARQRALWAAIEFAQKQIEYNHPVPCPDGISGCAVLHTVPTKRRRTAQEIEAAIRAFMNAPVCSTCQGCGDDGPFGTGNSCLNCDGLGYKVVPRCRPS